MEHGLTRISIIVCTQNRASLLTKCLDSIEITLLNCPSVRSEIVIVDNASTDNTSEVVKEWVKSSKFPVQLLYEPLKGLSNARNCAIKAAKGDLLVFTDDDCKVSKDYVSQAIGYDKGDITPVLRGGRVELGDSNDLPLTIKTSSTLKRWEKKQNSVRHENLADSVYGCNMVMRKELCNKLGAFDNRLGAGSGIPGGEDTDYIFRAYLAGVPIEYVPNMTVYHFHGRKSASEGNKLMKNYALGTGALFAKYIFQEPNFCRPLYWDIKNLVKDSIFRRNTFMPDLNFSHRDKIYNYFIGIKRYFLLSIKTGFNSKI